MEPLSAPFPGMDPYLEEPARWPGVHSRLINAISEQLNARLLPHFLVRIEERIYVTDPLERAPAPFIPDLYLVRGRESAGPVTTTAEALTPPVVIERSLDPVIHDRYLEIYDTQQRTVVTVIELLSPFNKATGTQGFEAFRRKRQLVMASPAHWVEIDLLRAGARPDEVKGRSDYYALLKRAGQDALEFWPIQLRDPLPTIAMPLRPPFPDALLNLQAALTLVYARGAYALDIDYTRPIPAPALPPADAAWARAQVQAWLQARPGPAEL